LQFIFGGWGRDASLLAEPPKMSPKGEKSVVISISLYYFCKAVRYKREQNLTILQLSKNEKANFYVGNNVATDVRCVQ
jgi:hypothetical protein